jgi:calcineurin-like phosphoesterase family protein
MTNFYVSDTHFDHDKIIALAKRPFADVDEMNREMVRRWNEVVWPDDTVHFLGDFAWKRPDYWSSQLHGDVVFYKGNHDDSFDLEYTEVDDGRFKLVLFHYPIVSWNGMYSGSLHFYGHVHGQPLDYMPLDWRARAFDVCVESLDYTPRTAEEIVMKGNR